MDRRETLNFHPAVTEWFQSCFDEPTPCQQAAWPAIQEGKHTLIAAPTGSGKTLAAFLAAIDDLVRQGQNGPLPEETQIVYVSPLKALSNDIQHNLEQPLDGILEVLKNHDLPAVEIRTKVRTGDTPQSARAAMRKHPPHILVTTPESLYILLTSDGGRDTLRTVRSVIVDEIHAIAGSKRGAHLCLSLERLEALAGRRLVRIGLSATQKPIDVVARLLVGERENETCEVVDTGHVRERDLAIEIPDTPLEAVMSGDAWGEIYDRLARLVDAHQTTLIFVNTRRLAERVTRHLSERIGEEHVTSHHGSLAKEARHNAEQRLKTGDLKALVATASLELGIDIGDVDLVCQLGSTRSIATFLQRVGRSGHAVGAKPKGRLFPFSRDELVECVALVDASDRGELDRLVIPQQPLDVLAQQIVAIVGAEEWEEDELHALIRRAFPYRDLTLKTFRKVIRMLAEGFSTRRGRRAAYLHHDAVNRRLRPRRGARLTALTCGGAIPDNADYDVVLEPEGTFIGTLNEDFAIESLPGDIFQLGNSSWRILRVEAGKVRVADAQGLPPTIPFWLGEAPGRTNELSGAVSRLREEIATALEHGANQPGPKTRAEIAADLNHRLGLVPSAAEQLVNYLAAARNALGTLPTLDTIILERFFDETGGMQLIIHSSFGSRLNRAWGLALRKHFCKKFNFELQAAATEDAIVLSLGETHSFALDDVPYYLNAKTVREVLIQAFLAAPMFNVRWRWNATISLAIPRFRGGKKVPPPLQRIQAEDLVAVVFPDQIACAENVPGEREIPEHPLVEQTIRDGLDDAMDIGGLEQLLSNLHEGKIRVVTCDLTEPSPLAQEILNAKPYAFLDDVPLEERRTQAVMSRRWLDPEAAADIGRLDVSAIERVRDEAWPEAQTPDELHDAMMVLGFITESEGNAIPSWSTHLESLITQRRAARVKHRDTAALWVAAERSSEVVKAFADIELQPVIQAPPGYEDTSSPREDALTELLRGRLSGLGPVSLETLVESAPWSSADVEQTLARLESEGFALRGSYNPGGETEWCERRLLARIHRYTVNRLRREIEPVSCAEFMRFLLSWQHVTPDENLEGPLALDKILDQLKGYELPAAAWEGDVLPARLADYESSWLDMLCQTGRYTWVRLTTGGDVARPNRTGPIRTSPIAIIPRRDVSAWSEITQQRTSGKIELSNSGRQLRDHLATHGASFFDELTEQTGLLRTQIEEALGELAVAGMASSDSFAGLRALLVPSNRRRPLGSHRRRRRASSHDIEDAGRWALLSPGSQTSEEMSIPGPDTLQHIAWSLLSRYGVVFKRVLERETTLPPWRDLVMVLRRMEARGEIRGGRFVVGPSGEQFALPEAVSKLREMRRKPASDTLVSLSGADPLNLVGILSPGPRLPALLTNRVLYKDGNPIALQVGKDVRFLERVEADLEWDTRNALLRKRIPPPLRSYLGNPQ